MAFIAARELRKALHPHYLTNIILAFSFLFLKSVPPFCAFLFDSCELDYKETEILFFAAVVIIFRARKQGKLNFIPYLSSACMIAKLGNILLYATHGPVYCVIYIVLCLLQLLLLPEPTYSGPENVSYFREEDLEEAIASDKRVTWLVELFTMWSPPCIDFAPVFAELSNKYGLDNLKFAKVDLARSAKIVEKYKINTAAVSKQLPTLVLFQNGKETDIRPIVNDKKKLVKFPLTYDNVVAEFDLNNIYEECKKSLSNKNEKKEKKEKVN